jgi:hypothetical protein
MMRPLQVAREAIRQRPHDPAEAAELGERRLQPLTERVFGRLPGKRWAWVAAWALVPWANAGMNLLLDTETKSAVWGQSGTVVILNYAALSFAVVMAIWGSRRIATQVEDLHGAAPFRELNSVAAPLLGAVGIALAFGVSALVEDGPVAAILRGITWLIVGTALWTFLWTYVSLQVGLYRLGGERVTDAARMDPGLGLRPVGDVAFTGLWILLAWLVPLVLTGLSDVVGVAIGAAVLAAALMTFFLSLVRVHHQMVRVKAEELTLARALYAEAYEPVRENPTLEKLEQQRNLLAAADALEKRAKAIHDWPIDESTLARVLTIATSVVAITIGRLILDPFGL